MMSLPSVSDYSILEKIGTGSYATVYKAFKKNGSKEVVAIKCVDKSTLSKTAIDNLITEINLLKILKHRHIVEMRDFFWDDGHIYIVMEYCDGGDLSSFIKRKHKLPENVCRKFLQQLALALKYLRSHEVCHMDLKPQNLLLTKRPQLTLKVGDFGFAQYLSPQETKFTIRGSPLYMAPEILLQNKYDARVDLWSVGVIMYECLFGKAPYSSSSFQELAEKIKDRRPIELPKGCHVSRECKDLLMSLLKHNPNERITFEQFFAHDFLDLVHAPIDENYEKAVALVQRAVKLDTEKNHRDAFHLYCDALRYFIPLLISTTIITRDTPLDTFRNALPVLRDHPVPVYLHAIERDATMLADEPDPQRKKALRLRVNDYIKRAERLKQVCHEDDTEKTGSSASSEGKTERPFKRTGSLDRNAYNDLRVLGRSTTGMTDALEIGEVGELYLAEGNYALALEKFQSSLSVLVPLLGKEPAGRRRELLLKQVQLWMKVAESTKGLLATKEIEDTQQGSTESQEQCTVQ